MNKQSASTTQLQLSLENDETLQRLVRTIDFAEGLTLLFAKCNVPTLRRKLATEAMRLLAAHGIDVAEIEFKAKTSHLRRTLRTRLSELPENGRRKAIFIYGLEHGLPRDEPAAPILSELNMGRELFHRDAPYALVFWLPDYALTAIARGAPDFWAWRSGVFEFEAEPVYLKEAFRLYAHDGIGRSAISNLSLEEKLRRRSVLHNLLSDYEDLKQDAQTLRERAEITSKLGMLNQELGETQQARQMYQQSLEINEKLGNQVGVLKSLSALAEVAQNQGKYDEAHHLYRKRMDLFEQQNDQKGIAESLRQLADLARAQKEYEEARRLQQQSLEIFEAFSDQRGIAICLFYLALIAIDQEKYEEADQLLQRSLAIGEKLGDQELIASILIMLGTVAIQQKEYEQARHRYQRASEIVKTIGNQLVLAYTLYALGTTSMLEGEYEESRRLYQESLQVFKELGNQDGITKTLHGLSTLAKLQERHEQAQRVGERINGLRQRVLELSAQSASPEAKDLQDQLTSLEAELKLDSPA
jgi:tetratricopeptide (TPR) repeat protein